MATRAIRPKREDGPGRGWPSLPERAPSIIRQDVPTTGRVIALVSLLLVAMGALGMLAPAWGLRYIIGPSWGFFWFALGVGGLLYHAFNEKDQQFRRTYAALGFILFCAGVILRVLPMKTCSADASFPTAYHASGWRWCSLPPSSATRLTRPFASASRCSSAWPAP
jgi:hypothetical protein